MNTMELSVYNKFLEPCCMCDSENTKIGVKEREALGDLKFTYNQLLILCLDCGFSFVNNRLSSETLKNRDLAERQTESLKQAESTKIVIEAIRSTLNGLTRSFSCDGAIGSSEVYSYYSSSRESYNRKVIVESTSNREAIGYITPVRSKEFTRNYTHAGR